MPKVELDVIHRHATGTGIPEAAGEIRRGRLPDLLPFDPDRSLARGVFLVPARGGSIARTAIEVFRHLAGPPPPPGGTDRLHQRDVQILCPVRSGPDGSREISDAIEREWMVHQEPIHDWGLSVGSKILWLRNDYTKAPLRDDRGEPVLDPTTGEPVCAGFMNGALGVVQHGTAKGARVEFDDDASDEIRQPDLEKLTRGWAISVHKAQGSAFQRVIVPVAKSRLLDRTLIYTAVTRAIETCVLVGDPDLIRTAVEIEPRAHKRRECLDIDAAAAGRDA